jgi:D-threo-aldose 1-dehydrogenase
VACVIAGARTPEEVRQNCTAMAAPIPRAFWAALKSEGLIPANASEPG